MGIIPIKLRLSGDKKAKKGLKGVDNSVSSLGKSALKLGVAYFGTQGVLSAFKQSIALAGNQELQEKKLAQALGSSTKGLLEQASALQQVSTFGDEAIIQQQSFLASLGMTEKQIKDIIPVAMDLASATGMSLESAVRNTAKTFSGMAGELGELVPQLRGLTAEQMKSGEAVKIMGEMFKGSALVETQTMTGAITQMNNAVGDVGEVIGGVLAPVVKSVSEKMKVFAESLNANKIKSFGVAFGGLAVSIGLYNSAILVAKFRTISFQATLVKTGWGALFVGAGLAVGKLLELSGAFGEVDRNIEEMERRYERLRSASWGEILAKGGDEFKARMKSAKESLLSTYEMSGQVLNALAYKVNEFGLESERVQNMITILIKNGQLVRKQADNEQTVSFSNFVNKQREKLATMQQEEAFIKKLIKEYPKLAKALKLTSDEGVKNQDTLKHGFADSISGLRQLIKGLFAQAMAGMIAREFTTKGILGTITASAGAIAVSSLFESLIPSFSKGGSMLVSGKQLMMVGDNATGMERVTVDPIGTPSSNTSGSNITVNISAPLVDETVRDSILPSIQNALNLNLA